MSPRVVSVHRIWDRAAHNAFTDLVRFHGRWFCTFREADTHVGSQGRVRILQSRDGFQWTSAAVLSETGIDLRDPKLSVTPNASLMLLMGGTYAGPRTAGRRQPRVCFSEDGLVWTRPRPVLAEGDWLWRVTWFRSHAYGFSYHLENARTWRITLHESSNGIDYRQIAAPGVPGKPNEATLRFRSDGAAVSLVRREGGDAAGWIGSSRPPYTTWKWRSAGVRVGGPNFIAGSNGSLWAAYRTYAREGPVTVVARMGRTSLRPVVTLPSGGDCSYPGLVWHRGLLWVSYYSSHEGKAAIYLARAKLP